MSEQTNTWGGTETTKGTGPLFVVRRPRFPGSSSPDSARQPS